MKPYFTWDSQKAERNRRKHGINFDEAATVFKDSLAFIFDDDVHSGEENREIIIGHSFSGRLLLVCFTQRGGQIRIISARMATRYERQDYEEYRQS
ncbi:MAG: BrnT family toxin [Caldilineaceae bacterium]|nr:BrnT family toxin [Caldilineaceae bacterium]